MTAVLEKPVAEVEALPEAQRQEVIAALLRRAARSGSCSPIRPSVVSLIPVRQEVRLWPL
jgi:hypothetical protein